MHTQKARERRSDRASTYKNQFVHPEVVILVVVGCRDLQILPVESIHF